MMNRLQEKLFKKIDIHISEEAKRVSGDVQDKVDRLISGGNTIEPVSWLYFSFLKMTGLTSSNIDFYTKNNRSGDITYGGDFDFGRYVSDIRADVALSYMVGVHIGEPGSLNYVFDRFGEEEFIDTLNMIIEGMMQVCLADISRLENNGNDRLKIGSENRANDELILQSCPFDYIGYMNETRLLFDFLEKMQEMVNWKLTIKSTAFAEKMILIFTDIRHLLNKEQFDDFIKYLDKIKRLSIKKIA